ncbi:MAG: phosphoadenylyl-sulfate reductase [Verrucomicrobia bacterium]|jgi:phosphoadenosine phosphosulfate reductase|nr:phosphoadenylyl-sulfate reductase [Verrucomicrobiota bacterium]
MLREKARPGETKAAASPEALERATAEERLRWALEAYGERLVLSTSFGIQAAVMLHMVTRHAPELPVVFVDTGYLFPETYRYAEELTERFGLNLKVVHPRRSPAWQEAVEGRRWEQGLEELEAYNRENKVEPMNRALRDLGAEAWLSGLRRSQAKSRADLRVVEKQQRTVKIHPVVDWSEKDIYEYQRAHELPMHPLWEQGYVSVGDWHSTAPLEQGMTPEKTRFNGLKRECGLHEASGQDDWQI